MTYAFCTIVSHISHSSVLSVPIIDRATLVELFFLNQKVSYGCSIRQISLRAEDSTWTLVFLRNASTALVFLRNNLRGTTLAWSRHQNFLIFWNFWENPLKIGLSDLKNDFSDRNNVIEDLTNGQNGWKVNVLPTDGPTDQLTNRPTDRHSGV